MLGGADPKGDRDIRRAAVPWCWRSSTTRWSTRSGAACTRNFRCSTISCRRSSRQGACGRKRDIEKEIFSIVSQVPDERGLQAQ